MDKSHIKPERIALILIATNICLLLNSDIHLPALPFLKNDLHTSEFKAQLVFIVFMIGAVFSRLIWGPVSDKYGRRKILLITVGLQAITQFGSALAPTIDWLLFWRSVQSLGAGIITVLGTAVISDLFRGDNRAKYLSLNEMTFPIAFVIAPILGAYIFDITQTWRAAFIFIFFVQTGCWLVFYYFLPETHKHTHEEKLLTSFKMYLRVIRDREFVLLNLVSGIAIGMGMMFSVISPFIYMEDLGVSINEYAFFQFTPMLINIMAALLYRNMVEYIKAEKLTDLGVKLLILLIPIYLVFAFNLVEVTAYKLVTVMCIQSAIIPFFLPGILARTMDLYPNIRGLASSASASIRSACAVVTMLFGSYYIGSNVAMLFKTQCVFILIVFFLFWLVTGVKKHTQEK